MTDTVLAAVISFFAAVVGGVLVALVNHALTIGRNRAETEKLNAETRKIRLEIEEIIQARTRRIDEAIANLSEDVATVKSEIIHAVAVDSDTRLVLQEDELEMSETSHASPKRTRKSSGK